jgi:hypothetical protein
MADPPKENLNNTRPNTGSIGKPKNIEDHMPALFSKENIGASQAEFIRRPHRVFEPSRIPPGICTAKDCFHLR